MYKIQTIKPIIIKRSFMKHQLDGYISSTVATHSRSVIVVQKLRLLKLGMRLRLVHSPTI